MRRALYLDFSIPLFESESSLKDFYLKLEDISKTINRTKNIKFYISLPLDFITLNKQKLDTFFETISTLLKDERVEFVVKDSFGVDSSNLNTNVQEFNTILSEYVVGYYFGEHRNFEGDKSIMIKNLINFYPYSGSISRKNYDKLTEMGYRNFFIDKSNLFSGTFIYNNQSTFIQCDSAIKSLLSGLLDKFTFDSFISSSISSNYEVFYLNLYSSFLHNKEEFMLNFSTLIHFMDHTDLIEYRFIDESFEMPVEKDLKKVIFHNELEKNNESEFYNISNKLSKFINHLKVTPEDMHNDDFKNTALWEGTSSQTVNDYLKFNFLVLSLISHNVDSKIVVLKDKLKNHLLNLIDELELYSIQDKELEEALKEYRSYIKQK